MPPPSDFATRLRHVRALVADGPPVRGALSRFITGQLGTNRAHFVRALLRGAGGHRSGYDPNQPRVPAGNPDGGQWTSSGGTIRLAMGDKPRGPPRLGWLLLFHEAMRLIDAFEMRTLSSQTFSKGSRSRRRFIPSLRW
jgi:hypothetical protein